MQAVVALVVVLAGQLGFWSLLRAGVFREALAGSAIFWCLAFPLWIAAGRRWWRLSATPDVALGLMLILITATCFYAADGLSDAAYCGGGYTDPRSSCWILPASRDAFLWAGMLNLPVALIAAALATMRTSALRAATEATGAVTGAGTGPNPVTALVIAAAILGIALVVFALLIVAAAGPPH